MVIETLDLCKTFRDKKRGKIKAVDNISIKCEEGKIVGLLGPNGAGKTTTLRIISTILKPSSGTAKVNGFDVQEEPEKVREIIGFLSGDTGLYDRLSAREMVRYFGRLSGMRDEYINKRMDLLFNQLDMAEFADTRIAKLSTGTKQKVSIARTIIHDPPVMVFDEPTSGLDVITSRNIVKFIKGCRGDGKTVIFSTHVMSEAEKLCDEIAIIHKGRVYAQGTLAELKKQIGLSDLEDIFIKLVGEV